jgi:hypothetical protein
MASAPIVHGLARSPSAECRQSDRGVEYLRRVALRLPGDNVIHAQRPCAGSRRPPAATAPGPPRRTFACAARARGGARSARIRLADEVARVDLTAGDRGHRRGVHPEAARLARAHRDHARLSVRSTCGEALRGDDRDLALAEAVAEQRRLDPPQAKRRDRRASRAAPARGPSARAARSWSDSPRPCRRRSCGDRPSGCDRPS